MKTFVNPLPESGVQKNQFLVLFLILLAATGCGGMANLESSSQPAVPKNELPKMGYAIQVGAFSNLTYAVRLSESLQDQGLDAYYFVHSAGLYKVRFGNMLSKEMAQAKAKSLQAAGIIDAYYIVGPENYPSAEPPGSDKKALRDKIVGSAKRYLGVPYRWGGSSPESGFDCSGLTMAVYQLNGLNLPRSSSAQWRAGSQVDRSQLSKADLVFFATSGGSRISHVGIYVGDGRFIHAPGRGKKICITSFSNLYFKDHFLGARTYL
jgi:cell wall-associated NlpC family hydrolase